MRDRRLSRACLSEKNETTFRGRIVHPIDNEVQECHACSHKTALVWTKSRVESVWDFSDFCIEFYDNYRIGNQKPSKTTYRRRKLGLTGAEAESTFLPHRPEFGTQ